MTLNLVGHIDATFSGKRMRFELSRDEIVAVENSLDEGAYSCLSRLVRGDWRVRDLQIVLSAAIPLSQSGLDSRSAQMMFRRIPSMPALARIEPVPAVLRALGHNPPARYAVLAMKIVEAALFGLAEDQASFDENEAA